MIGGLPQRRGPRRVIGDREPASVLRRWFWLVGACGWKVRPGAPVQGPGQAFCPLRSLPALGFPGFSELGLTVPGSQPHVATDPNWTVDRADRGPLHRVELLQHMRGPCHGRIISSAKHPPARPVLLPWAGLDGCQEAVWASVLRAGWWQPPRRVDREVGQRPGGRQQDQADNGQSTNLAAGRGGAGSKRSHVGCQPDRGVDGSSRSRPPERWSSACWRACRVV